jgi:hypothetical protein
MGCCLALTIGCNTCLVLVRGVGDIKSEVLAFTPLGSTLSEVRAHCLRTRMACQERSNVGYWDNRKNAVVGDQHISAHLPDSRTSCGFVTSQSVYWGFDVKGRLIEVGIVQSTDSL